jgi:aminoglycoside phosphotransferase (APT) family kinase protein
MTGGRESDLEASATPTPEIDADLARRLVASQFPQWAALPVRPVELSGWDNRTFRLGEQLSIRLPSAGWYSLAVEKEQRWLPQLASQLPLPIPVPVGRGAPGLGYPYPWSVYRWIDGQPTTLADVEDLTQFAATLASFLVALHGVDATGGPAPGPHNFFRGGPLTTYAEETTRAVAALADEVDPTAVLAVWDDAVAATWRGDPVWFHGDIASGNLLLRDGRLAAVIDFGTSGVGDPACDVVIAWTLLSGASRQVYRESLAVDDATWSRGRGWALWKALITLDGSRRGDSEVAAQSRYVLAQVLRDHRGG